MKLPGSSQQQPFRNGVKSFLKVTSYFPSSLISQDIYYKSHSEAISSIMTKIEMSKEIHFENLKLFWLLAV